MKLKFNSKFIQMKKKSFSHQGQERITGTTDLLLIDETLQSESRVSFQSASSATPRNSSRE